MVGCAGFFAADRVAGRVLDGLDSRAGIPQDEAPAIEADNVPYNVIVRCARPGKEDAGTHVARYNIGQFFAQSANSVVVSAESEGNAESSVAQRRKAVWREANVVAFHDVQRGVSTRKQYAAVPVGWK